MRATITGLAVLALLQGACGLTVDAAYKLGSGRYTKTVEDTAPTEQNIERLEYEATVGDTTVADTAVADTTVADTAVADTAVADTTGAPTLAKTSVLNLTCFNRTRRIERHWSVSKTYEYRGGYDPSVYLATAIMDGVVGAIIAGSALGICSSDANDVSCRHMLWASPFALDLVYSLIRRKTVKAPVLVDKERHGDALRFAATPLQEQPLTCDPAIQVWLGHVSGPSDESALEGRGEGRSRTLDARAIQLPRDAQGQLQFTSESANHWARNYGATLWARQPDSSLQPIELDRCAALRPFASSFAADARKSFDRDCPLPQPR